MKIQSYKDLVVWQKSIDFVEQVYLLTEDFPKTEIYGLTNQIRRAAVSVASNVAEGSQRQSKVEFVRFVNIAKGSLGELETQLIIANRLKFLTKDDFKKLSNGLEEISKMLSGLRNSLEQNKAKLTTRYSLQATQ